MQVGGYCDLSVGRVERIEHAALLSLRSNSNLTIKLTDKRGAVVVWYTDLYITEARRQLFNISSYCLLDHDSTSNHQAIISQTIDNLITSGDLPSTASNLIVPQTRTVHFYLLPKIHKPDCPRVAMGAHMGPGYACLFVGFVEQSLFLNNTSTIPHLYLRYIDDHINAASCSCEELKQFIKFANAFHPTLKFTWNFSDISVPFLDLSISISRNRFTIDIHFKPTDSHSYLNYTSSHPPSCKNAIPYSQFLCLCCI
eukprot:g29925.t1